MPAVIYRKTEAGKAEIAQRRAGLPPAVRQLLILVNGSDSVQALEVKGLVDVRLHIDTLLSLQLIERVLEPIKPVAPPPPPVPQTTVPMAPAIETDPQLLLALQRRAYQALQPHFGPDTLTVAQALLAARSLTDYHAALGGVEVKLAIYMGRKQAAREVQALRHSA